LKGLSDKSRAERGFRAVAGMESWRHKRAKRVGRGFAPAAPEAKTRIPFGIQENSVTGASLTKCKGGKEIEH